MISTDCFDEVDVLVGFESGLLFCWYYGRGLDRERGYL